MKKFNSAFTMLEFIFVLIIVGILAIAIIPRVDTTAPLRDAAYQVLSDIRYTQHLAMIDDRYDANDNEWFKERWTIKFFQNLSYDSAHCAGKNYPNIWSYTIYSDFMGTHSGNPNVNEIAKSPLNKNKLLTSTCTITLCLKDCTSANNDEKITIYIEPETGYSHIN